MSSFRQSAVEVERRTETGAGNKWEWESERRVGKGQREGLWHSHHICGRQQHLCKRSGEDDVLVSISFSVNCSGNSLRVPLKTNGPASFFLTRTSLYLLSCRFEVQNWIEFNFFPQRSPRQTYKPQNICFSIAVHLSRLHRSKLWKMQGPYGWNGFGTQESCLNTTTRELQFFFYVPLSFACVTHLFLVDRL